jgi:hypothetical protein
MRVEVKEGEDIASALSRSSASTRPPTIKTVPVVRPFNSTSSVPRPGLVPSNIHFQSQFRGFPQLSETDLLNVSKIMKLGGFNIQEAVQIYLKK